MRFFIDTARLEGIHRAWDRELIRAVSEEPSSIAGEGHDCREIRKEISGCMAAPGFGEVMVAPGFGEVEKGRGSAEAGITEGGETAKLHSDMEGKIPMSKEGWKAVQIIRCRGHPIAICPMISTSVRQPMHIVQ